MDIKSLLSGIALSLATTVAVADDAIKPLFDADRFTGSIRIESLDGNTVYQYSNLAQDGSFLPASTFKIPNTLIAVEEGVISEAGDAIKWDGVERSYAPWNKDQTLASAFAYSCIWCYQRFAGEIGNNKYQQYLQRFEYGNQKTGSDVTTFWLEGDLRVSVKDQIDFLRKVHNQTLPVKQHSYDVLRKVMLVEKNEKYSLWAKTGWAGKNGWFVGYVERDGNTWLFANYVRIEERDQLKYRKQVLMDSLKAKGII